MSCPKCSLVDRVRLFPYLCQCGKVYQGASPRTPQPPRGKHRLPTLPCTHRGDVTGKANCGCQGDSSVYACDLHGECMIRKLKPGDVPVVMSDGSERTTDGLQFCNSCDDRQPLNLAEVAILTVHWNPHGFARLRETYYEWLPTIDYPVQCMELVFGDSEPEIEGSTVVRGGERNVLWQKERLINLAIEQLPQSVKFVAWVDHDLVFDNPDWLVDGVAMLRDGFDAVQMFDSIAYLDPHGSELNRRTTAAADWIAGRRPSIGPGGAWIASRDFLQRIGGLYDRNIVGGGDAVWFSGMTGFRTRFLDRQPAAVQADSMRWIGGIGKASADYVDGMVKHIWHGDKGNRQYISRDAILCDHEFDPGRHIEIDANGLLAWTDAAPEALRRAVSEYFLSRRDDG